MAHFKDFYLSITQSRIDALKLYDRGFLDDVLKAVVVDDEFREEIEGIVEEISPQDTNLSQQELVRMSLLGQLKYELGYTQSFADCTGVIAAMENGTMVHGRNMDLDTSNVKGMNSVLNAIFTRQGRVVFSGPALFGLVGMSTGYRPGSFSIQQNTRGAEHHRSQWGPRTLRAGKAGGKPFGYEVRRLLDQSISYGDVVERLAATKWLAPQYFVVAGAGPFEGAVVTVDRTAPRSRADVQRIDPAKASRWFLVQTNDDHWKEANDGRRAVAQITMLRQGQRRVKQGSVWKAIREFPVCNQNTWFSWIVSPSLGTDYLGTQACEV